MCKIRSNAEDKKNSVVDKETKLSTIYRNKYRISLDHEILRDHTTFSTLELRPMSSFLAYVGFTKPGREGD